MGPGSPRRTQRSEEATADMLTSPTGIIDEAHKNCNRLHPSRSQRQRHRQQASTAAGTSRQRWPPFAPSPHRRDEAKSIMRRREEEFGSMPGPLLPDLPDLILLLFLLGEYLW